MLGLGHFYFALTQSVFASARFKGVRTLRRILVGILFSVSQYRRAESSKVLYFHSPIIPVVGFRGARRGLPKKADSMT